MECSGHYGYIRLNLPIFHIGYFKKVVNILQAVCKYCSRLLLDEAQLEFYRKGAIGKKIYLTRAISKFKSLLVDCKKTKACPHCGVLAGKVKKMPGHPTKVLFQPSM